MHMDMSQEPFYTKILKYNAADKDQRNLARQTFCVSLCSQNAHGDVTRASFYTRICREKVTPRDRENRFREPAQSKCTWTCQNFMREFSGKLPQTKIKDGSRGRLCASLHSRNAHKSSQEACTNPPGHADSQKSHIMREFSGKMPQANIKQTPRRRLCASLRSRNAHGHRTRASLCENLQERSRKLDGAPWSSTGLYSYRNNPSVWIQCLGNIL